MLSLGPHSDPVVPRVSTLPDREAEKSSDAPKVS